MEILARTDRPGLDPAEAFVVFGEATVTMADGGRRFAFLSTCGNPDCGCSDAQITLVDPQANTRIAVKVDLATRRGEIVDGSDGGAQDRVAEVVSDRVLATLGDADRAELERLIDLVLAS